MEEGSYFPIIAEKDLPNGERLFFEIEGEAIVLFNIAGNFYAIADLCTHDEGPLGEGDLDGFDLICPRHGARFDIRTGQAIRLPAVTPTKSYPTRIVDGVVEVLLNSDQ